MNSTIRQLQDDFHAALLGGDAAALEAMVASECRIIGPKGFFIDRDEWIGTHQDSDYQQVRLESRDVELRTYGDTAIRWEVQDSRCLYKGATIDGLFRVTQVWIRQAETERWRLAALQYTAVPQP
jgi:ketosteroid isomerase-like protein